MIFSMKYLKELFMCSSDDLKYKNTVLVYIAANIVLVLIAIIFNIIFDSGIPLVILFGLFLYLLIFLVLG